MARSTKTMAVEGAEPPPIRNRPRPGAENACLISPVVEIVFSRWSTPILWTLNEKGRQRFVELGREIGTVTPKVLTQRLRQLERDGLVSRTYHPEVPPRVEYEITELGRSLAPVFRVLAEWTDTRMDQVRQSRRDYDASGGRLP
jgi:DNA-binding HxlR family transcriptional regulator